MLFNAARYTLGAAIAVTLSAGCGSGPQVVPTAFGPVGTTNQLAQTRPFVNPRPYDSLAMHDGILTGRGARGRSFMDRHAIGKPLLFVSDGNVEIYLQSGKNKLVGQIAGLPSLDLATDDAANLYSANLALSYSNVTIYAPPYTKGPKLTLQGGRENLGVAVSRQGTVAVMACTIPSGSQCGQGVIFYAVGSTTPCARVLVDPAAFSGGFGLGAFDHDGNLYVDGQNANTNAPAFAKIGGGCHPKKAKPLTVANAFAYAGSIKIDKSGRIVVLALTNSNTPVIYAYDAPKKGSLGSPVSTTPLANSGNLAGTFALRGTGRGLWAGVDGLTPSYASGASEYTYPSGGAPVKTVVGPVESVTYGVAVTPALVP